MNAFRQASFDTFALSSAVFHDIAAPRMAMNGPGIYFVLRDQELRQISWQNVHQTIYAILHFKMDTLYNNSATFIGYFESFTRNILTSFLHVRSIKKM